MMQNLTIRSLLRQSMLALLLLALGACASSPDSDPAERSRAPYQGGGDWDCQQAGDGNWRCLPAPPAVSDDATSAAGVVDDSAAVVALVS